MSDFKRGQNPKDAMDIGDKRLRKMKDVGMQDQDIERMSHVKFFVKANTNETFCLWKENKYEYKNEHNWRQVTSGFALTLGEIENRPIVLEFAFNYIYDNLVCFYHGCSQLVDNKMIDDFIEFCWPIKYDGNRRAMTDATNFHHCFQFCENEFYEKNKDKQKIRWI